MVPVSSTFKVIDRAICSISCCWYGKFAEHCFSYACCRVLMSHINSGYSTDRKTAMALSWSSTKAETLVKISLISFGCFKKSCLKISKEFVDIAKRYGSKLLKL